jgi:hypothetical protein
MFVLGFMQAQFKLDAFAQFYRLVAVWSGYNERVLFDLDYATQQAHFFPWLCLLFEAESLCR